MAVLERTASPTQRGESKHETLGAAGTKDGSKPEVRDTWTSLAGRPLLTASLEAVPGKTRRTEF
jgi:hypothetical protein